MRKGEVHLIVPGFVNGGEMLGGFFDEGNEDETHEGVGDAAFGYYVLDLLDCRTERLVLVVISFGMPYW